jgi:hypothetical protein
VLADETDTMVPFRIPVTPCQSPKVIGLLDSRGDSQKLRDWVERRYLRLHLFDSCQDNETKGTKNCEKSVQRGNVYFILLV